MAWLIDEDETEGGRATASNRRTVPPTDLEQGLYILDEPEAALSPQRQLTFLKIIHDLTTPGHAQFLIATHSPIILSYPGAVLFGLDGDGIREIEYRETKHFLITRDFLNSPDRFFKHLFETVEDTGTDA